MWSAPRAEFGASALPAGFCDAGACMCSGLVFRIGGSMLNIAFRLTLPTLSAVAVHGGPTLMFTNMAPRRSFLLCLSTSHSTGCHTQGITILLDPRWFLNRLRSGSTWSCGGSAAGLDCDKRAEEMELSATEKSGRLAQSLNLKRDPFRVVRPLIMLPALALSGCGDKPPAPAAAAARCPAGHGGAASQTHRDGLGRVHRTVRGGGRGSGPRPGRGLRHQC